MVAYSFRPQFIAPIQFGLGVRPTIEDRARAQIGEWKRQTIRAKGRRRHARLGDELQLYTGMRTRSCRLIGRAICRSTADITIWVDDDDRKFVVRVDGKLLGPRQLAAFARSDGFATVSQMALFWLKEHGVGKFEGIVIRWEPRS
jgi:hypothetical protein